MIPCVVVPAILVLFWADWKAKKIGALSLASSTYAREKLLVGQMVERRSFFATCLYYARRIDAVGLLLMGFAFGCILSPFTLYTTAKGGYKNRECPFFHNYATCVVVAIYMSYSRGFCRY